MSGTEKRTCTVRTKAGICGRPTRDAAFICDGCLNQVRADLADVAGISPSNHRLHYSEELAATVSRQAVVGGRVGGQSSEPPSPFNVGASNVADGLRAAVRRAALVVFTPSGHRLVSVAPSLPADPTSVPADLGDRLRLVLDTRAARRARAAGQRVFDPVRADADLVTTAKFVAEHLDELRLRSDAGVLLGDITAAVGRARKAIDPVKGERMYLGPCWNWIDGAECGEDVHAEKGETFAFCPRCNARYNVVTRRAALLSSAEDDVWPLKHITQLLPAMMGRTVTRQQLYAWRTRGRLHAAASVLRPGWVDIEGASPTPDPEPCPSCNPDAVDEPGVECDVCGDVGWSIQPDLLYRVGDVIDLLAATKPRTAEPAQASTSAPIADVDQVDEAAFDITELVVRLQVGPPSQMKASSS
jgi:hypothetical protein